MRATAAAAVVAAACGGGGEPAKNPPVLYLAPFESETEVQLIDHDPPMF